MTRGQRPSLAEIGMTGGQFWGLMTRPMCIEHVLHTGRVPGSPMEGLTSPPRIPVRKGPE